MSWVLHEDFLFIVELRLTGLRSPMDDVRSLLSGLLFDNDRRRLLCLKLVGAQAARLRQLSSMLYVVALDRNVYVLILGAVNLI